ncbi:MAG: endonuclease NucS [Thermoplasmatota archaeon]
MQVLRDPEPAVAVAFVRGELALLGAGRGRLLEIVGDCEVLYDGRARSRLARGTRLVVVKPDGTLLVHTARGAKPVNWQPPGASLEVTSDGPVVRLTARRARPEERVEIRFHAIEVLLAIPLRDGAELALVGTEDDVQRLLAQRPELVEEGLVIGRRERHRERGFYDLDGHDREGRRVIVEVKRTTAGVAEAQQLWRYVEALRPGVVRGILVAPRVAPKARALLLAHGLEWKELSWESLVEPIEALRHAGQASLATFGS